MRKPHPTPVHPAFLRGALRGGLAGLFCAAGLIVTTHFALAPPGQPDTAPRSFGPRARPVVANLYPQWVTEDRLLSREEYLYAKEVLLSLCEADEDLDREIMGSEAMSGKFRASRQELVQLSTAPLTRAIRDMGYHTVTVTVMTQCETCARGYEILFDGKSVAPEDNWPRVVVLQSTETGDIIPVELPIHKALRYIARERIALEGWTRNFPALRKSFSFR